MKPIVIANWKMNETSSQSRELISGLLEKTKEYSDKVEVVICPPFTALEAAKDLGDFRKGAQDIHWEDKGTFTGEVSGPMLTDLGCKYVIIGHSERRWKLGEGNEIVNLKFRAALRNKLIPILCVGERAEERQAGLTEQVLREQLQEAWREVGRDDIDRVVIAYEPVWAIGTGQVKSREAATVPIIDEAYSFIKDFLKNENIDDKVRLVYGGSVDSDNVKELLAIDSNAGFLVGGASLEVAEFSEIIKKIAVNDFS